MRTKRDSVNVRLVLGNLIDQKWIDEIKTYDDPILEIKEGNIYVHTLDEEMASSVPLPDNDFMRSEFQRAWNGALKYAGDRIGADLSKYRRPFKEA